VTGFVQGGGLGFLFVPLTTVTFATLAPEQRADGTGLYNLSRNVGSSIGISVVSYLLIRNQQINHATIASQITASNHGFDNGVVLQAWSPWTAGGRAALDQVIQMQALHHQLYRRFQIDDDPLACCHPSRPAAAASADDTANDYAMAME
jgi:DHA2 family multidrug resistance protein